MTTRLLIIGNPRETHVGGHLANGARSAGLETTLVDLEQAFAGPKLLQTACWHLLGHRPARLESFSRECVERCRQRPPDLVLTTGLAPLSPSALLRLQEMKIPTANFLTDDPWNPAHRAPWFMRALPHYDHIFTPRRANMAELEALGGPKVHYLPFGYAPEIHHPPAPMSDAERAKWKSDVLFIGGADEDRAAVMRPLRDAGLRLSLWGGYWDRIPDLRQFAHGHAGPDEFRKLVANAGVNICLVRRANRDGHSMRTFELAAIGGCLAVEDTAEHREIFGADDECVRFFDSPMRLIDICQELLLNPRVQSRLAHASFLHVTNERRSAYRDRIVTLIESVRSVAMAFQGFRC